MAAGKLKEAIPYLEKAVAFNPPSRSTRWCLTRAYRDYGKLPEALKAAEEMIRLDPEYAPGYFELARIYDLGGNNVRAVEAYEVYLQLAPNFGDNEVVRARTRAIRSTMSKKDLGTC